MKSIGFIIFWLLLAVAPAVAQPGEDLLPVTVLYTGNDHLTHFKDESRLWKDFGLGPDASQTQFENADSIGVLRLAKESFFDWHPAPRKQYVLVISGQFEIKAGDGEKRIFSPGKILLADDAIGRGHQTRALGDQPAVIICVAIP